MISVPLLRSGLLTAGLTLLAAGPVSAAVIFSDNFNSPDGTLLSNTTGWTRILGSPNPAMTITDGSLSVQSVISPASPERVYTDLGHAYSTGSLYVGFDFTVTDLPASNNTLGFFAIDTSGVSNTTVGLSFNVGAGDAGGYKVGVALSASATASSPTSVYSTTSYALNTSNRIVIEYNFFEGALNNTANLYLNGTVVATAVYGATGAEVASFRHFALRQPTAANSTAVGFDDLVIATTFAEAATFAAVPEPSSCAAFLGAVALAGVVCQRRRRV